MSDNLQRNSEEEFVRFAAPLLSTSACQRIGNITFLGLLSPKFQRVKCPIFANANAVHDGGSRLDHSYEVAYLLWSLFKRIQPDDEVLRYAVAWGLLHDVATWPLSHSSEPVFEAVTGIDSRRLRVMMIVGSPKLPEALVLRKALVAFGVKPEVLVSLFAKQGPPADPRFTALWQLVHSSATPDTLEGIGRSGKVFGVEVPEPNDVLKHLDQTIELHPRQGFKKRMTEFWEQKARIYRNFINRPDVVAWESTWTSALRRHNGRISLGDSLYLDEFALIQKVLRLDELKYVGLIRYKGPMDYFVAPCKHTNDFNSIMEMFQKRVLDWVSPPCVPSNGCLALSS